MKVLVKVMANRLDIARITEENRVNDANWIVAFEQDNSIGKFVPQEVPGPVIEERPMYLDAYGIEQAYEHENGMIAMFYKGRELLAVKTDELLATLEIRFAENIIEPKGDA